MHRGNWVSTDEAHNRMNNMELLSGYGVKVC